MTRARARLALPLICLLALASCAGPEKLSQQGDKELAQGNARKAYDKAKKALQKDPGNTHAAQLMTSAAKQLVEGRRKDILERASLSDTLLAGRRALELEAFRRELAGFQVTLPPDTSFEHHEHLIRRAAAATAYRDGQDALKSRRAREAYEDFVLARDR